MIKKTIVVLLLMVTSNVILIAQNKAFKFGTRIQLSTGSFTTYSENIQKEYVDGRETFSGLQQSLQVTIFSPVSFFNIGLGGGFSLQTGDVISSFRIIPKAFLMAEIGNGKKRTLMSCILSVGIMKGTIENKTCFYFGGGPSFNIGNKFNKVTVSINPYFEYHAGESAIRYYYDTHWNQQGTKEPYTRHFRTFTLNLSCIVQLNFNRKIKKEKDK